MITFVKKAEPQPVPDESEDNRFERIRKAGLERQRKSDTDRTRRPARQTAEDNVLGVDDEPLALDLNDLQLGIEAAVGQPAGPL